MNIVIVGAGKVGYFLAKRLSQNKHKVSIIDRDKAICDEIAKELDILVINGDACEPDILMQADIACANVLAAVTGDDEDNLIVCQIAKEKFNIHRTVGRVNNPDNEKTFAELGIDVPVDDTKIIAKIIEEEASYSDFVNLLSFKRGKLSIVRVDLPENAPVIGKYVHEIKWPENSTLVSILRGEEVIIARGDTVFKPGDDIIALTLVGNEPALLSLLIGRV